MRQFKFFVGYVDISIWDLAMPRMRSYQEATYIMNDLVAVQPMRGPTGRIFYMDYNYDRGQMNENVRV